MSAPETRPGRLTLVSTPVGNLGDITARAVHVLREADTVAAEDTRRSKVLLDHLGIDRQLERLDAHTMAQRGPALLERGGWLAYLTDAGTPGISDPGADLVRLAIAVGTPIEVLPGATAFVPALVASGLPTARFTFEGFLPRSGATRRRRLTAIAASGATSIVYESPTRLLTTLADLVTACGGKREASVSRELSKLHEETLRGSLELLHAHYAAAGVKGEIVIVVAPADDAHDAEDRGPALPRDAADIATRLAAAGVHGRLLRDALSALGVPRNAAYRLSLRRDDGDGGAEPRDA